MIIDLKNRPVNDEVLKEREVIPKGFIPEREEKMEFIKVGKNYLIKNSNGIIVNEEEKLKLEKKELVINDIKSNNCQKETTKKIKKLNKKIKEVTDKEDATDEVLEKIEKPEVTENAVIKEASSIN